MCIEDLQLSLIEHIQHDYDGDVDDDDVDRDHEGAAVSAYSDDDEHIFNMNELRIVAMMLG